MSLSDNDYPYIRLWGKMMGSQQYYIITVVEQARAEHAPETAIYKSGDRWATIDGCRNDSALRQMGLPERTPEHKARHAWALVQAVNELGRSAGAYGGLGFLLALELHRQGITAKAFDSVYLSGDPRVSKIREPLLDKTFVELERIEGGYINPSIHHLSLSLTQWDGEDSL